MSFEAPPAGRLASIFAVAAPCCRAQKAARVLTSSSSNVSTCAASRTLASYMRPLRVVASAQRAHDYKQPALVIICGRHWWLLDPPQLVLTPLS